MFLFILYYSLFSVHILELILIFYFFFSCYNFSRPGQNQNPPPKLPDRPYNNSNNQSSNRTFYQNWFSIMIIIIIWMYIGNMICSSVKSMYLYKSIFLFRIIHIIWGQFSAGFPFRISRLSPQSRLPIVLDLS